MANTPKTCVDNCKPPSLNRGDIRNEGKYYRNLRRKHVKQRYQDDVVDQPDFFGFKLAKDFWKDLKRERGDPSVNCYQCTPNPVCSILMQTGFGQSIPCHVALLDIDAINLTFPTAKVVASYQEEEATSEHPGNPCHYELLPFEGGKKALLVLENELEKDFPLGPKRPTTDEEKDSARSIQDWHDAMVKIERNVTKS